MGNKHRSRKTGTRSISRRLSELGYPSYQHYLASPHWAEVRRRFQASSCCSRHDGKPCCAACGGTDVRLAVHHKTYKRLGAESMMDLMLVCDGCHGAIHDYDYGGSLWSASKAIVMKRRAEREGRSPYRAEQLVSGDPNDSSVPF